MARIRFEGVSHAFGDRRVLDEITVDFDELRVGVIGANGSGKSTFVRMVNGLVAPTSGRVTVDGLDANRDAREVRQRVSFLFSSPDAQILMPTVREDIAFSLRRLRLSREQQDERIRGALERVGLEGYEDHPSQGLSSGQKQLLALAAVLVTDPQVLLCDEPTTLLDLANTRVVMSLLDSLPQQVVLVTHHLEHVESWPRVLVFDDGRIAFDGPGAKAVPLYVSSVGERPR